MRMGVCMQPKFHHSRKKDLDPEGWAEAAKPPADMHVEQEDQWAVLRHEVERPETQWPNTPMPLERDADYQRDTDENEVPAFTSFAQLPHTPPTVDIVVVGVGGGGMNAIGRMMSAGVRGVRFIAMNTDAQVLSLSQARDRLCLGQHYTKGLGAGGNAATGLRAATESAAEIRAVLGDADMVFIAAGMGGGTGTGAAPVVASIAKKLGALTLGIVTLPFSFEGTRRRRVAEQGLGDLSAEVDALITVPNDRLLNTVAREYNLTEAFKVADDVLRQGVQGIAEVINVPGMINVDFADVRSVLREAGTALMSIGQGKGRNRAQQAAAEAIAGGFLNVTIRGATRVLFNISGGEDMTLFEVNEVAEYLGEAIDDTADITFGAVVDPALRDTLRVTLIAAGMQEVPTNRLQAIRLDQYGQPILRSTGSGGTPATPPGYASSPVTPMTQHTPAPGRTGQPGQRSLPPTAPPSTPAPRPARPSGSVPSMGKPGSTGQTTPPVPPTRQQRSLNDLRGIRSLGRRQNRDQDRDNR